MKADGWGWGGGGGGGLVVVVGLNHSRYQVICIQIFKTGILLRCWNKVTTIVETGCGFSVVPWWGVKAQLTSGRFRGEVLRRGYRQFPGGRFCGGVLRRS